MRNIEQLREQVVAADQNFKQFIEQHAKYSKRLIGLVNAVEKRIQAPQDEVERQRAEIASLNEENEQLCNIVLTLLQTINAGNLDRQSKEIRELVLKVSGIVEGDPDEGKAPPAVEAIAEVVDAIAETETCTITDLPSGTAPAERDLNDIMERVSDLASKIEVKQSPDGDRQAAENEAEDAPLLLQRRVAIR
ncbi:MAG: hypothetical protein O7I42_03875 [Alphaproteobacteria bacterium]|nr:hypothetical protein [Alphaproteobacteria bacterium]